MKTFIKLLLLAAVALPSWVTTAAQSLVYPPEGTTKEEWKLVSAWYTNVGTIDDPVFDPTVSFDRNTVNIIIDGDQMYIQGFCKALPESWVVGTIIGSTVTFAKNQWFGNGVNGAHHYLVGEGVFNGQYNDDGDPIIHEGTAVDVVMNYDATNKILTMSNSSLYILDCDRVGGLVVESGQVGVDNTISSWGYHEGLEIYQPATKQMKTLSAAELANVKYKYPINTEANEASVLEPVTVTDAESAAKAIALIRKIYMDPQFPGPYTRGYTSAGNPEGTVSYSAVGTISSRAYSNSYGWNIPNKTSLKQYQNYNFYWFNPEDYKPTDEGYTVLLVEVQDNFEFNDAWYDTYKYTGGYYNPYTNNAYQNLLYYVQNTIKRVTLLTDAKRTGNNLTSGTLFKINADDINRFFLISKGQVRYYNNEYSSYSNGEPNYYYDYYDGGGYNDQSCERMFYHMFEQFSPTLGTEEGQTKADIYNVLVSANPMGKEKTGFPVYHDCISVPYADLEKYTRYGSTYKRGAGGHEFQMSEANSSVNYDLRDLLFFVPDRRMTQHDGWQYVSPFDGSTIDVDNRDALTSDNTDQKFINYCKEYAPRMDMYAIQLNEIEGEQVGSAKVYELNLNWASNMFNFLPGEPQEFFLWRKVTDAHGASTFERVYKCAMNADGTLALDANGKLVYTNEQVTVRGIFGKFTIDYVDYIDMDQTGKLVTYYVSGHDVEGFLEIVNSNQQSYAVPGYDKSVRLSLQLESDYYSKFVVNQEKNNYYNEVVVTNNYGTSVTANFLQNGTVIYFQRFDNSITDQNNNENTPTIVAQATVTNKDLTNGTITVRMDYLNQAEFTGAKLGATNQPETFTFTFKKGDTEALVDFGTDPNTKESTFRFYDNFTADVSKNGHPGLYLYRAFFEAAQSFPLENGTDATSNKVYSNLKPAVIHKTDPSVGGAFTLNQVLADNAMSQTLPESPTYSITLEQGAKGDFYGYQFGHWEDKENVTVPSVIAANADNFYGYAQNQGETYSLHFGTDPEFSEDQSGPSATLQDLELQGKENGGAYIYVTQAVDGKENTYGAPRKATAVGKLDVKVVEPDEDHRLISRHRWFDGGDWYSYYNIYLQFEALDIPAGYELYKVRAWRQVENGAEILGEELTSRAARSEVGAGWYMYEDINFGDQIDATGTKKMSCSTVASSLVGDRPTSIPKPVNPDGTGGGRLFDYDLTPNQNGNGNQYVEQNVSGEVRATFGALRLKNVDENPGTLENLNANFKVRAYFTKNSNPLTNVSNGNVLPQAKPIYVLGNVGTRWDPTVGTPLYSDDGITYSGSYDVTDSEDYNNGNNGYGLFRIATDLAQNNDDGGWAYVNSKCLGPVSNGNFWVAEEHFGQKLNLTPGTNNFRVQPGKYNLTVNLQNNTLVISKGGAAQAPSRAGENPYDFDYYIAEGTAEFKSSDYGPIITGIGAVKMDVNREVVGVTYVNTIGQVSSTPWQGVNMVVTRYSDGSTTTQKVIK